MKSDLPVIIVGGGPAGMVAGLLFARAGVHGSYLSLDEEGRVALLVGELSSPRLLHSPSPSVKR